MWLSSSKPVTVLANTVSPTGCPCLESKQTHRNGQSVKRVNSEHTELKVKPRLLPVLGYHFFIHKKFSAPHTVFTVLVLLYIIYIYKHMLNALSEDEPQASHIYIFSASELTPVL